MTNTMTKTEKLINAFTKGEQLTEKQIKTRFGIANPRAHVSYLRQNGYNIVLNKSMNKASKYQLTEARKAR